MSKPTLVYFPVRGRAEVIRLLLAQAGVEHQEHPVGSGGAPIEGRPTDFTALKATGDLPFEALPVWEESDGFRLAQSRAIENHLARLHSLHGKTDRESAQVDQALGAIDDVRTEIRRLPTAEASKRAEVREELLTKSLPKWMGWLDRLLGKNRGGEGFLVGDSATVADLSLYYLLELMRDNGFAPAVDGFPRLAAFATRIAEMPRIKAYLASAERPALTHLPR